MRVIIYSRMNSISRLLQQVFYICVIEHFVPLIQVDLFVVTSRGVLVQEIPEPGNRRRFGDSCISMLHPSEIIRDKYSSGFTTDSFIDSLPVTVIRGHPREDKKNLQILMWLCVNTSGPMTRWGFEHIILDASGEFIKYFRSSVAELWGSINIFVSFVEVLITRMAKSLVPWKFLGGISEVQGMDRIRFFRKFLKNNHIDLYYR